MEDRPASPLFLAATILAGFVGAVLLVVVWHQLGLAAPSETGSYTYTHRLTASIGWAFAVAVFLLSFALGWASRNDWPVAAGMMAPFPLAYAIEMLRDSTSHNILPLEVSFYWLPAFLLTYVGAFIGKGVRGKTATT